MWFAELMMGLLTIALVGFMFFMFDEVILKGYFATKLRKRFNVDEIK